MTEDLVIGGAVVGGTIILLKTLRSFMKKTTEYGGRVSGDLDPAEWEQKIQHIVQTSLVSNSATQLEILRRLAEGQVKIEEGLVRLIALQEQITLKAIINSK
jgi:hypothetical protein